MMWGALSVFDEFAVTLAVALLASALALVVAPRFSAYSFSRSLADRILYGLVVLYVAVFVTLTFLRHSTFNSYGYDLGIFDQVVWNSLQGRLFENSIMSFAPNFLGNHFSPILLALVPLYALWSDPRALLILQTLSLASATLPLYWYVRAQLGYKLALVISLAYLLSPGLQYVNLYDFHEIALATPLLAFALFFLLRRRYLPLAVCLGIALLTKEEVTFIAVAFGLYILLKQREMRWGAVVLLGAAAWGGFVFRVGIPYFRAGEFYFVSRYTYLGATLTDMANTVFTHPIVLLTNLLIPPKFEFVLHLLIPLAFLPLIGLEIFALAIPTFGYLLLSDNTNQFSIHAQYSAPLLPILFFAAAVAMRRLLARGLTSRAVAALAALILTASSVSYYLQAPGPFTRNFEPALYLPSTHTGVGHDLLKSIPASAAVLAQTNFVPHLSHRTQVFAFPEIADLRDTEYLLLDQRTPILTAVPLDEFQQAWDAVLNSPYFETIRAEDGYILKKRAPYVPAQPLAIQFGDQITLFGYTVESGEPAARGDRARIVLTWRADQNIRERYVAFIHLVDTQDRIVAQDDREPAKGWFRTDQWNAGDVTPDRFTLELPADLPAGEYRIATGFYRASDQKNLTAHDPRGNPLGVAPTIGTLIVK